MERNLYVLKLLPSRPILFCIKMAGPGIKLDGDSDQRHNRQNNNHSHDGNDQINDAFDRRSRSRNGDGLSSEQGNAIQHFYIHLIELSWRTSGTTLARTPNRSHWLTR